ncbi:MAG: hypothetical protein ACRDP5_28735 [Streptosporangiaceae bacterium]
MAVILPFKDTDDAIRLAKRHVLRPGRVTGGNGVGSAALGMSQLNQRSESVL